FFSSRRRHTRFSRDWSSDVCSSDLWSLDWMPTAEAVVEISARAFDAAGNSAVSDTVTVTVVGQGGTVGGVITRTPAEVGGGGAVDRKSVVEGKSVKRGGGRSMDRRE